MSRTRNISETLFKCTICHKVWLVWTYDIFLCPLNPSIIDMYTVTSRNKINIHNTEVTIVSLCQNMSVKNNFLFAVSRFISWDNHNYYLRRQWAVCLRTVWPDGWTDKEWEPMWNARNYLLIGCISVIVDVCKISGDKH